jgi:hypothetical protein
VTPVSASPRLLVLAGCGPNRTGEKKTRPFGGRVESTFWRRVEETSRDRLADQRFEVYVKRVVQRKSGHRQNGDIRHARPKVVAKRQQRLVTL